MQNYIEISQDDGLLASLAMILNNDKTALSCSSGTAFPTANVQIGQLCFRTDENKLYQTKDAATWTEVGDLNKSFTQHKADLVSRKEIVNDPSTPNGMALLRDDSLPRYVSSANGATGTIAIKLPTKRTSSMVSLKIRGYEYLAGKGAWEMDVSGYTYTSGWLTNVSAFSSASLPWGTSVRFAEDANNAYILLGATTTRWYYSKIWIEEVMIGHFGVNSIMSDPSKYEISLITDESTLTTQVTATVNAGTSAMAVNDGVYLSTAQTISGAKTFSGATKVTNSTASTSATTGALVVTGGVGVGGAVNVGGNAAITGTLTATGAATLNGGVISTTGVFGSTVDSTNSSTGAVKIEGGLGVAKSIYLGGSLNAAMDGSFGGALGVTGKITAGSVDVVGAIKIASTTNSTSKDTGALIIEGGIGIEGDIYASNVYAALKGNADTATKLANVRTINGVDFDGSTNITIEDNTKIRIGAYGLGLSNGYSASTFNKTALDDATGWYSGIVKYSDAALPGTYGHIIRIGGGTSGTNGGWYNDLAFTTGGGVHSRRKTNVATWGDWVTHITSDNIGIQVVASAAKLTTARTINGVPFDGSTNITISNLPTEVTIGTGQGESYQLVKFGNYGKVGGSGQAQYIQTGKWLSEAGRQIGFSLISDAGTQISSLLLGTTAAYYFDGSDATALAKVTDNVASATKFATARTINGVPFDGTANITIADDTKLSLAGGTLTGALNGTTAVFSGSVKVGTGIQSTVAVSFLSGSSAQKINTGGVLVSGSYSDASLVPIYGIYSKGGLLTGATTVSTTLTALGQGTSAPITTGHVNVGTTYGYVPMLSGSTQSSSGYRQNISIGAYRPQSTWTGGAVYIAMGGNDNYPTEAFLFELGRTISHTGGTIALKGNADTATKLATARTINGVSFDGTANITVADSTKVPLAGGTMTGNLSANALGVNNTVSTGGLGLSLYGGAQAGMPGYGLAFSGTADFGTHGSVVGDWATYFTMSGATNRGWIFKSGNAAGGNVASISATGVITGNQLALTGFGDANYIANGNGDAASYSSHNMIIRSWWGIGFRDNGDVCRTVLDTRTGNFSTLGAIAAASVTASGNVTAYSDKRIKKNIKKIPDALAKVEALKGVIFERKDTKEKQTGLIAQDVEAVLPEAVSRVASTDETRKFVKDDELLTVSYGSLAGLFVEAIKELNKKLEDQAKLIDKQSLLIENLLNKKVSHP